LSSEVNRFCLFGACASEVDFFIFANKIEKSTTGGISRFSLDIYNFHQHSSNLSLYQKGGHSFGIKMFSNLPQSLKKATGNIKQFKTALKFYLHTHSFYSIDEYFIVNKQ
jgi:hypothetical protein